MKKYIVKLLAVYIITLSVTGCKKETKFLDAKPQKALSTISTIEDCQLLLNNESIFNQDVTPGMFIGYTNEYFVGQDIFNVAEGWQKNIYTYSNDIFGTQPDYNWAGLYTQIYYANTVLDALPKIKGIDDELEKANMIRGSALFFRANAFYNLIQAYAMPYDATTASSQPGILLRLSSDLNLKYKRASLSICFDQVLNDLKLSADFLPTLNGFPTHPSKVAAYALLSRIYLGMSDYQNAFRYANLTLQLKNDLTDYNEIDSSSPFFFTTDLSLYPLNEDIFHSLNRSAVLTSYTNATVSDDIFNSYDSNDLRKVCFFSSEYDGTNRFKGSYGFKEFGQFTGLATDEIYLIRSECYARLGNTSAAMNDLNTLLIKRFKKPFVPLEATDADDALRQILEQRDKELYFRGIKWFDLRRLNKDPRFAVTLTRTIGGKTYTLPPNDLRYAMPIPADEIANGIEQNPR